MVRLVWMATAAAASYAASADNSPVNVTTIPPTTKTPSCNDSNGVQFTCPPSTRAPTPEPTRPPTTKLPTTSPVPICSKNGVQFTCRPPTRAPTPEPTRPPTTSPVPICSKNGVQFTCPPPTTTSPPPFPGHCLLAEDNVDYGGFDIKSTSQSISERCCFDCSVTPNCQLYVWTDYNGGTCWLKSKKGPQSYLHGAKAAVVNRPPKCSKVEDNVDYYGNDLTSTSQASATDCCADCDVTPGCKLYVWSSYNGGTCWLKHAQGPKTTLFGARAAVVIKKCTQERDVDYFGGDITITLRQLASDCCQDCQATPGCKHYTWTSSHGGTCWLKSTKGQPRPLNGAVSGSTP